LEKKKEKGGEGGTGNAPHLSPLFPPKEEEGKKEKKKGKINSHYFSGPERRGKGIRLSKLYITHCRFIGKRRKKGGRTTKCTLFGGEEDKGGASSFLSVACGRREKEGREKGGEEGRNLAFPSLQEKEKRGKERGSSTGRGVRGKRGEWKSPAS